MLVAAVVLASLPAARATQVVVAGFHGEEPPEKSRTVGCFIAAAVGVIFVCCSALVRATRKFWSVALRTKETGIQTDPVIYDFSAQPVAEPAKPNSRPQARRAPEVWVSGHGKKYHYSPACVEEKASTSIKTYAPCNLCSGP